MNETATTLILLFLTSSIGALIYWCITHAGGSSAGTNPGRDPHALSADRQDAIHTR